MNLTFLKSFSQYSWHIYHINSYLGTGNKNIIGMALASGENYLGNRELEYLRRDFRFWYVKVYIFKQIIQNLLSITFKIQKYELVKIEIKYFIFVRGESRSIGNPENTPRRGVSSLPPYTFQFSQFLTSMCLFSSLVLYWHDGKQCLWLLVCGPGLFIESDSVRINTMI